ncbi:helix-turn-helix transcriptional regulator [Adlercreutzia caecimuris]|uniref:helix-turn-helix transcriptional regulator n=1 Tax=Adlercreutzia caecimuris TaxID=671266 RepID=UPI002494E7FC|nr:helix-turn-helix transcriptional regulator [Adlercreutzia caecimuris]
MNRLSLSDRILEERSRNHLTQEELARRLGVSKAAVSKWECGQSLPDIALLPKMASLFSITLDDLFGYEPVASEEKREEIVGQLQGLLAKEPVQAAEYAEQQVARYWSDSELLRAVGLVLCAKAIEPSAPDEAERSESASCLADLAERVLRRALQLDPDGPSTDFTLQALCMLLAAEGKEGQADELIEKMVPAKPNTAAIILAGIAIRTGNPKGAGIALKRQLLFSLLEVASCAQALAGVEGINVEELDDILALAVGIQEPSGFEALSPTLVPIVRIALATRFAESGDGDRALDELERFVKDLECCCEMFENPQNPPFFKSVDEFLWQNGDEKADEARGEAAASLRSSFASSIASNESWAAFRGNPRFNAIMRRLGEEEASV